MLVEEIAEKEISLLREEPLITECLIGLRYSYCEIMVDDEKYLGVSITPIEDLLNVSPSLRLPKTIHELQRLVRSPNPYDRTIAQALLNALGSYLIRTIEQGEIELIEADIIGLIGRYVAEPVLLVGNMGPLRRKLVEQGISEIYVVERNPLNRHNALPDVSLPRLIGKAKTIIITGATLVNDTIDYIIEKAGNNKNLVLVGPTASVYPPIIVPRYFNIVASMIPRNIDAVKKVIKAGGGRWDFSRYCDSYLFAGEKN